MKTYKDRKTSALLLLSLTTARASSFQSSTLNSDISKQATMRQIIQNSIMELIISWICT